MYHGKIYPLRQINAYKKIRKLFETCTTFCGLPVCIYFLNFDDMTRISYENYGEIKMNVIVTFDSQGFAIIIDSFNKDVTYSLEEFLTFFE